MEYNSQRAKLLMPEYGRNVQKMVEYLLTIEDKEKRLQQATIVIKLMSVLTPHLKTIEDYEHKLWDHLYQMTDLKLDVDGPYPPPTEEQLQKKPDLIPYPKKQTRFRHLGTNLQKLVDKALEDDVEKQEKYSQTITYYMKLAYANWHKEPAHDDLIKNELAQLSKGVLQYQSSNFKINFDFKSPSNGKNNSNRNHKKKKNNRNKNTNY